MNNFAISWRLRKTLAGAVILTSVLISLFQRIPDLSVNVLGTFNLVQTLLFMGLVLLCCNYSAVSEKKRLVTWIVVGIAALSLVVRSYLYFIFDMQSEDDYSTYRTIYTVLNVFMIVLCVLMVVFSQGMMRLFFIMLALVYTFTTIQNFLELSEDTTLYIVQGLNLSITSCLSSLFLFGAVLPDSRDFCIDSEDEYTHPGVGIWGIVFLAALILFIVVIGSNISDICALRFNNLYSHHDFELSMMFHEKEAFYAHLGVYMFLPAMISLTFMLMYVNLNGGYNVNGVLTGLCGLSAIVALLFCLGSHYFEEFAFTATTIILLFSAVQALCSLITIMVSKDPVRSSMQKYLAFSAISSFMIMSLLLGRNMFRNLSHDYNYCLSIIMGLSMYVPTALKYISPKIKAPVIAGVFGALLMVNIIMLAIIADSLY